MRNSKLKAAIETSISRSQHPNHCRYDQIVQLLIWKHTIVVLWLLRILKSL